MADNLPEKRNCSCVLEKMPHRIIRNWKYKYREKQE